MAAENLGLEIRTLSNLIYNKLNQMTMEKESLTIHQCWILQHLVEHSDKEVRQKDIEQLLIKLHGDIPERELEQFQITLRKLWTNMEQ